MRIAVHHTRNIPQDNFSRRWIPELKKRGIDVLAFDFRDADVIDSIRECAGAMWHFYHRPDDMQCTMRILQTIETNLDIPVFPDLKTRWHYDDKVAQHYFFQAINAPKIQSWVFWNHEEALEFTKKCTYPIVFKLAVGAGSANVIKLNSQKEAVDILNKAFVTGFFPYTVNEYKPRLLPTSRSELSLMIKRFAQGARHALFDDYPSAPIHYQLQKNYAYFQEYIPDNKYDIRITIIGNRAFGFIRHNRVGDFRASGSGEIDVNPENIPNEAVRIAHEISKANNFQSMAYDFLRSPDGKVLLNEISYCYVNKAVQGCPGHWDFDLNWHEGQMWPEEAIVEDFLNAISRSKKNG